VVVLVIMQGALMATATTINIFVNTSNNLAAATTVVETAAALAIAPSRER